MYAGLCWTIILIVFIANFCEGGGGALNASTRADLQVVRTSHGERVSLPCRVVAQQPLSWSPVTWSLVVVVVDQRPPEDVDRFIDYIYIDGRVVGRFAERFSLAQSNDDSGYRNLTISASVPSDAGLYLCVENNGAGRSHFVRLFVADAATTRGPSSGNNNNNTKSSFTTPSSDILAINPVKTAQYNWLFALFVAIGLSIPVVIVCVVFGCRNVAERRKASHDKERNERLLE